MSARATESAATAERIRAMHTARVAAELATADRLCPGSDAVASRARTFCDVALVKGLRGVAEEAGGAAMSGADGEAIARALEALGYDPESVLMTLSRPEPGADPVRCARRLRLQIESVDPLVVIAMDSVAAEDVAGAFGISVLGPGEPVRVLGRQVLALDGFEASLVDEGAKRAMWSQLKAVARTPRADA